nr:hypothetical protein [Tanacetum cinerariifolium]
MALVMKINIIDSSSFYHYVVEQESGDITRQQIDLFSLIRALNPTKVKTGSRPRAPHELPLLTLTAPRVIEMDEPAVATNSSGVPSIIERSPLDFAHKAEVSGKETAAPEMPPPEDVPITTASETDQAVETVAVEPPVVRESRKRGHEGIDANAPPKSLRRDHADLRPSGSSRGGKSLVAMQLCLAYNVFVSEGVPADVSDPDPLAFVDAPSPHPADVAQSSQGAAVAGDPESENVSSRAEVGSPGSVYRPEWGVTNGSLLDTPEACQDLVDHAAPPGYFSELRHMHNEDFLGQYNINLARQVAMGSQLRLRFEQEAKLLRKSVAQKKKPGSTAGDGGKYEEGCRREECWVEPRIRKNARLVLETSVSAGVAKGMSEGLKHGVEHGHAQLTVESLEAYDPEAKAKFAAALQSLKDLKFPMLDQLEGLKDAPMDVIMAALYLESDTGGMPLNLYVTFVPAHLSLPSPCTRRSDGVPVSVPTVVPQGLALLLVDAATQTDLEDA